VGKKDDFWAQFDPNYDGPDLRQSTYDTYRREHSGDDLGFEGWKDWQRSLFYIEPFEPPVYEPKEFQQLPVTPTTPMTPTTPRGQAPQPQVINRYLEQVMSKVGGEGSGQTEVGKALRAKSSGGSE
jgi:hypothetical protein